MSICFFHDRVTDGVMAKKVHTLSIASLSLSLSTIYDVTYLLMLTKVQAIVHGASSHTGQIASLSLIEL